MVTQVQGWVLQSVLMRCLLTVGLFVLLPGAWAATVVIAIDRLGDRIEPRDTAPPPQWLIVGAWLTVGALATWGAIELISDIGELRRLR